MSAAVVATVGGSRAAGVVQRQRRRTLPLLAVQAPHPQRQLQWRGLPRVLPHQPLLSAPRAHGGEVKHKGHPLAAGKWRQYASSMDAQGTDEPLASASSSGSALTGAAITLSSSSSGSSMDQLGSSSDEGEAQEGGSGGVQVDLQLPRRSMLVKFTCNRCEGRSERLVNPLAWERGMVIAQCQHCSVWHKLADAAGLVVEIRYNEE